MIEPLGPDEVLVRLRRTGWSIGDTVLDGPTGPIWQVCGSNGVCLLEPEGATRDEAWRRAYERVEAAETGITEVVRWRLQFRILTLMIVAAGVAIVCAIYVIEPEILFLLCCLTVLVLGPLFGAFWTAIRYQPGRLDPFTGGIAGGAVQSVVLSLAFAVVSKAPLPMCLTLLVGAAELHALVGLFAGFIASIYLLVTPIRVSRDGS